MRQSDLPRLPLEAIDADVCKTLQDSLKQQPSKCYQTLAVLQAELSHAIAQRKIKGPNPVSGIKRVKSQPRTTIWRQEQIDAFLKVARPSLRLAALLLFYTAQRPSDVLALTKGHVIELNGQLCIRARQEKTGELVDVPVHPELEAALRERLADTSNGLMLVPSPTGLPWTRRNFSRAWDAARRKAKLPPLQRRDMRRTAVLSMAVAGCTVPFIASITGHSVKSIEDMLKIYLPRRTEVAVAAIQKWAAAPRQSLDAALDNVVELTRPTVAKARTRSPRPAAQKLNA